MSQDQIALAIGLFILGNGTTIGLLTRWFVSHAINYTHLQRDVKELQKEKLDQDAFNKQVLLDLKGLSIKIDKK